MNFDNLAIISGQDLLPVKLIEKLKSLNKTCTVVFFQDQINQACLKSCEKYNFEYEVFPLGSIGKIIGFLKDKEVKNLVLAGSIKRPSFLNLKFDAKGMIWLKEIGKKIFSGDDELLKKLNDLLEIEGFNIIPSHEILKDLVIKSDQVLTKKIPDAMDWQDINRGKNILKHLSVLDIGQSIVVQQGLVLGIEAIEGTAELIKRIAPFKRDGRGGVLIKMTKTDQLEKIDIPTIGIQSIRQAYESGLEGIAVESLKTYIIDMEETIKEADNLNLFLVGVD